MADRSKQYQDAKSMRALYRKLRKGKEKHVVGIRASAFDALDGMRAEIFPFENKTFIVLDRDSQSDAVYQAEWITARSYPN